MSWDWLVGGMAHRYCLRNQVPLVGMSFMSDVVIFLSYLGIGTVLWRVAHTRRRALASFLKLWVMFGIFIVACGLGHLFDAVTLWVPLYWPAAVWDVFTALVSWSTFMLLWREEATLKAVRSPAELEAMNAKLHYLLEMVRARVPSKETVQRVEDAVRDIRHQVDLPDPDDFEELEPEDDKS